MGTKTRNIFEGKVRVRVCGIVVRDSKILMVNIKSPTRENSFWMPPGGGVEFSESLETALKREMLEETGLKVNSSRLLYISEYLKGGWHAIEFYFLCDNYEGEAKLGNDPELNDAEQMIKELKWFSAEEAATAELFPGFIEKDFQQLLKGEIIGPLFVRQ